MLDSDKVDQFYNLIKSDYYPHESDLNWLKIILISPNHFDTKSHIEQTICTSNNVKYNNNNYKHCIDCGAPFEASGKSRRRKIRCDECQKAYRLKYKANKEREYRQI